MVIVRSLECILLNKGGVFDVLEEMKVMGVKMYGKFDLVGNDLDEGWLLGRETGEWKMPLFVDEILSKIW